MQLSRLSSNRRDSLKCGPAWPSLQAEPGPHFRLIWPGVSELGWVLGQTVSAYFRQNSASVKYSYVCHFLANVNSRSCSLYAIARPSVVCLSVVCLSVVWNVRAPYSGGSNFRQYFYGVRYLGHPLTSTENFTEIVPREPLRRGS